MSVIIETGFDGGTYGLNHPRLCWRKLPGTITASVSPEGFDGSFAYEEDVVNAWRPGVMPAFWTIEFDGDQDVSYVGIGAHTLGATGGTVQVQVSDGAGGWTDVAGALGNPSGDNEAMLFLFETKTVGAVRLVVTGSLLPPEFGYIAVGEATVFPRLATFTGLPITESQRVEYRDNTSMTGKPLGRTVQRDGLEFSVSVQHLPETWRADEWEPFREAMERGGRQFFFYAARPEKYPAEVALAWMREPAPFNRALPNARVSGEISMTCGGYRQ